ncbi:hypothetical protein XENOCAPTIV_012814, partial [Xenoophorus captivus]
MNGQMGPSVRPQISMTSMTRHPSREQLIDYLMLKVSQQPHGPPRIPHDMLRQEIQQGSLHLCPGLILRSLDFEQHIITATESKLVLSCLPASSF